MSWGLELFFKISQIFFLVYLLIYASYLFLSVAIGAWRLYHLDKMHDIHNETADAVERIVPWLIENGYKILTVSQLYDYYEEDLSLHMGHAYAGDPESAPADSDASDSSEDPEKKDAEEDTED